MRVGEAVLPPSPRLSLGAASTRVVLPRKGWQGSRVKSCDAVKMPLAQCGIGRRSSQILRAALATTRLRRDNDFYAASP